jgi:Transglycosylase SLT domain
MLAEAAQSSTDRSQIIAALKQASDATGSDFHYLLGTAMRESSLKPQAQSSTSSATGLFQFVGQTWLGLVKENGAKYGLNSYAAAISQGADGRFHVDNAADRQAILALRKDPKIAALMEGEFANQTRATLESTLGRGVCNGELYAAHFLGPAAACKLIQTNASKPGAQAANLFPQAADANRNVFYRADGTPKTVREVYNWTLQQPSGTDAVAARTANSRATYNTTAPSTLGDNSALLSSVMNWTPHLSMFPSSGDENDTSLPMAPFLMTPGVMDLLSSVAPS